MARDLSAYKNLYLETASVYVHHMMEDITRLLERPSDKYSLNNMYISAHSMKSQSEVMGYLSMGKISRVIERICHDAKESHTPISSVVLEIIQTALQQMRNSLQAIEKTNSENDLSDMTAELEKISLGHN